MTDLEALELAERNEATAADCARWSREARAKETAALGVGDEKEALRWRKTAKMWSQQARQLKDDAAALRARLGKKPQVNIRGAWRGATSVKKW